MQVAICKAWCNESYRRVVALGHQVFGGIGYCEEHDLPLYYRRARVAEAAFGDADFHRKIVAEELYQSL
jgi:alkylation response protein AidB-like acyl-CoA dehydrogenase